MVKKNNRAEIELLDGIRDTANKYGMNSRTVMKILEEAIQRDKEAWESHPEILPEQWWDDKHSRYVDFNSVTDPIFKRK